MRTAATAPAPESLAPIWELSLRPDGITLVPSGLLEINNSYLIPTYVAIRSLVTIAGDALLNLDAIAKRLGISKTNRYALGRITRALYVLQDLGLISGLPAPPLKRLSLFCVVVPFGAEAKSKTLRAHKFGAIYHHDLMAFQEIRETTGLDIVPYLNHLVALRSQMKLISYEDADFFSDTFSVVTEETLKTSRLKNVSDIENTLEAYSKANVFAWAKFERPNKTKKTPSKLVAIVNHGRNNRERLDKAIKFSCPRNYSKVKLTRVSY